jgi:hypothetical protein
MKLRFDPLPPLLASGNEALLYFVRRDLLDEEVGSASRLWTLPAATRLFRKQSPNGSWPRTGGEKQSAVNYPLIETWRQFRFLVAQHGFTREHPQARKAAEFLFSCQTEEGDIRGMLANQYATYYTGAIMALLIESGYGEDPRIEKGFRWLLAMRQDDGGWTIPLLTRRFDRATQYRLTSSYAEPVAPDRAKPFSHNWTGMVLRAFAAHPKYRGSEAAGTGARLLASRFFRPDSYTSYRAAGYWVKFEHPFWWNNLVAALDSISLIDPSTDCEDIKQALEWLGGHQEERGLWKLSYDKAGGKEKETAKAAETKLWLGLAICRIFKRFFGSIGGS